MVESYEDVDPNLLEEEYEPTEKEVEIISFFSVIDSDNKMNLNIKVKNNGDGPNWCWELTKLDSSGNDIQTWRGVKTFEYTDSYWCKIYPISEPVWNGRIKVGVAVRGADWKRLYTDERTFTAERESSSGS